MGLDSPQSLFRVSPDSSFHPVELHLRDEYFPIDTTFPLEKPATANENLALATCANKTTKRKPMLLLVEDNHINMKVCLDHALETSFPSVITSIRTNASKASRNLYKEEQLRVRHSGEWSASVAGISEYAEPL